MPFSGLTCGLRGQGGAESCVVVTEVSPKGGFRRNPLGVKAAASRKAITEGKARVGLVFDQRSWGAFG